MLDKIYPVLNDPKGGFFLPKFVQTSKYDPYTLSSPWSWNLSDSNSLKTAATICNDDALNAENYPCVPDTLAYILDPSVAVVLKLTGLQILGLSNVYTERPICAADGVTVTQDVQFSTLTPPPFPPPTTPSITISGNFSLTLNCCCSQDKKTCLPNTSTGQDGLGTFLATIPNPKDQVKTPATGTIVFVIEQIAPGVLTIQATSVLFALPVNQDGNPSIYIDIDITSAGNVPEFNQLAENAFNSALGINQILVNLNAALNTTSALQQFSTVITNEIDGYLKQNHMYPFNNPSVAIF